MQYQEHSHISFSIIGLIGLSENTLWFSLLWARSLA